MSPPTGDTALLARQWRPAILSVLLLTLIAGGAFPVALFGIAGALFPYQRSGSLLLHDGAVVGSSLIAQGFTGVEWFHPRPSAAGSGYDGTASAGTNLGPNNPRLKDGADAFLGVRALAAQYRRDNGLSADTPIPIDAVTRSASGLDPHISPANAYLQAARVAGARGLAEAALRALVAAHVRGPQLGFLGEPRVSVLELNLALARIQRGTVPVSR